MNEERYNRYLVDKEFTWKSRFIWNGLEGDMPKNSIGIATFEKETKLLTQNIVKSRNSSTAKFNYLWDIDKGTMRYVPGEAAVVNTKDTTDYKDSGSKFF